MLLGLLLCARAELPAASLIPPRSVAEMASGSDVVVLAWARGSTSHRQGAYIVTRTEFFAQSCLKGGLRFGEGFTVQTLGGEVDGETWAVPGSPRFEPGGSYLLSLRVKPDGLYRPSLLAYGVFREAAGAGGAPLLVPVEASRELHAFPRPDGETVEPPAAALRDELLAHLDRVLAGTERWDGAALAASAADHLPPTPEGGGGAAPAGCSFFESNGQKWRWRTFDTGGTATMLADSRGDPSLAGGGFKQVQEGMNLWMGIADTSFNLIYGGTAEVSIDCSAGGAARNGIIIFNDPCSEMDGGVLAVGGPSAAGTHTFDGATWLTVTGWIVIVNDGAGGVGAGNYVFLLGHELGHGLGFGHVEDGNALMYGACCHNVNATDIKCGSYAYPSPDPSNERPAVDAGGDRSLTIVGDTVLLRGTASDDGLPAAGELTTMWRQLGGPGTVTFGDATSLETTASFSHSGSYLLSLSAHDGQLLRIDVAVVDVRIFAGSRISVSFQQGVAGYAGTLDTSIAQSDPSANRGSQTLLRVDGDDPADSAQATQSLLRFDAVFGSKPSQVPPGAEISSAVLELNTEDAGDGAAFHRLLADWTEAASWNTFGGDGLQPGKELLSSADATLRSPGGGSSSVDVTQSVAAWSRDPCKSFGWGLLPLGTNGWTLSSSEGTTKPRLVIERPAVERRTLIRVGDRWSYFKGRSDPAAGWNDLGFAAGAGWLQGPTGIGYGDGDDATTLSDMEGSYAAIYCRREFSVPAPEVVGRLILSIDYDDGFVAYLNGVEAARSGTMGAPGSPVARGTLAASRDAGRVETYRLDPSLLASGTNVLAVEVHNTSIDSSDLSFLPELLAEDLFIADGEEWSYFRGVAAPPADWIQPQFDDAAWEAGPAGIGYGDGDDLTELADMQDGYVTVFCRKRFDLPTEPLSKPPRLTIVCDDGVVVYLNGVEIDRDNMPSGAVTHTTEASASREPTEIGIDLPLARLLPGENLLAASVHNSALDSSDLSFMAVLVPAPEAGSDVACGETFRRGDASGNGSIDLEDAVRILFHLFAGSASVRCPDAADFNDDGVLVLSDAINLLSYLFRRGPMPALPGVQCGLDPTEDALEACSATCGA